jgi:hypothetical protein
MARGSSRDKRAKFVELAQKRVNKAINTLRLIGNLSNKGNYSYDADDVARIFAVLEGELKKVRTRFHTATISEEEFRL